MLFQVSLLLHISILKWTILEAGILRSYGLPAPKRISGLPLIISKFK